MKVEKMAWSLVVVATIALLVADVHAQDRQGRRRGMRMFGAGGSVASLVEEEKVQTELKLNEDQISKIKELVAEQRQTMMSKIRELRDSDDDPQNMMETMRELRNGMAGQEIETMKEILNEDQFARYQQLSVQLMGIQALASESVAEKIGLDDEHRKEIEQVFADGRQRTQEKFRELRESGDRSGFREMMEELQKQTEEEVMAVLSEQQKEKFKELKGEPFEFPERRRGQRQRQDF